MSTIALTSLAPVIRSKNAGPTQFTIDLFFSSGEGFVVAAESTALSCAGVASLYGLEPTQVQRHLLPSIRAIKFSMPRVVCAGNPGDGDVYGAQQHAPLLEVML